MTDTNEPKKPFKEKWHEAFQKISSSDPIRKLRTFTADNKGESAAYLLLLIGLLITFANPIWGSALIGVLVGFYFYDEIFNNLSTIKQTIKNKGALKTSMLGTLFLLFLMAYPLFFVTLALIVAIMQIVRISR